MTSERLVGAVLAVVAGLALCFYGVATDRAPVWVLGIAVMFCDDVVFFLFGLRRKGGQR